MNLSKIKKYRFEIIILLISAAGLGATLFFKRQINAEILATTPLQVSGSQGFGLAPGASGMVYTTPHSESGPSKNQLRVIGKSEYSVLKTPKGIIGVEVGSKKFYVLHNEAVFGYCPNANGQRCLYLHDGSWIEYDDNWAKESRLRFGSRAFEANEKKESDRASRDIRAAKKTKKNAKKLNQ
jgi:hypothetical protein